MNAQQHLLWDFNEIQHLSDDLICCFRITMSSQPLLSLSHNDTTQRVYNMLDYSIVSGEMLGNTFYAGGRLHLIFRKMRAILANNMEFNRHISLDWIIENILKYGDSFIVVLKSRHYSGNTQQVYDSMIQSALSAYGIKSTMDTFDAHEPTPYNSILAVCKYLIIRDPLTRYTINISGNIDDFTDDIITLATVFGYKVVVNSDDSIPTINIGQFVTMFMSNGVWFGSIHPRPMEAIPIIRRVPKDGMSILNFSIAMVIVSDKNYDGEVPRPKINIGNVLNLAEKHPCKFNDTVTMIVLNAASQVVILNNNSLLFTDRTNDAGYKVDMHYDDFFLGLSVCPVTHKIVMSAEVSKYAAIHRN